MAEQAKSTSSDAANRLIDTIGDTEKAALDAVRSFIDTVDGAFPDVSEDGPRRKIIDSAFQMTEQLVGASNQLARSIIDATADTVGGRERPTD